MDSQSKRESKVREYRGQAQVATDAAQSTTLEQVRLKHERAAHVWTELALNEEARIARPSIAQAAPAVRMKAMTNDEKLAAIERGVGGSYNLAAPRTSDTLGAMAFQHVAAQALGIAKGRGYVLRRLQDGPHIDGLLITVGIEKTTVVSPAASQHERPLTPVGES